MALRLDVDRFLEDLSGRYAKPYREALGDLMLGIGTGDRELAARARTRLNDVMRETIGVGEVLGASVVLQHAARVVATDDMVLGRYHQAMMIFAGQPVQAVLPRVTFEEAVGDMVTRAPVTIQPAARRTAARIAELYSEGRVVAFVRSAEQAVTERVQDLIGQAMREGIAEVDIGRRIVQNVDFVRKVTDSWTEGYARMVFRTNLNTAVTAGRFRQAQDPDIREVIPAMRFDAVGDADTRPNHLAADGVVLSVTNPAWNRIASPLGYSCRCQVSLVSAPELRRMGRFRADGTLIESVVSEEARPDDGFRHGGRPDLMLAEALV